jgi:hypothetical protein
MQVSTLSVPPDKFIQFVRDNPNLRVYAMPDAYCRTDRPILCVSHELFSKMLEEMGYDKEGKNERD